MSYYSHTAEFMYLDKDLNNSSVTLLESIATRTLNRDDATKHTRTYNWQVWDINVFPLGLDTNGFLDDDKAVDYDHTKHWYHKSHLVKVFKSWMDKPIEDIRPLVDYSTTGNNLYYIMIAVAKDMACRLAKFHKREGILLIRGELDRPYLALISDDGVITQEFDMRDYYNVHVDLKYDPLCTIFKGKTIDFHHTVIVPKDYIPVPMFVDTFAALFTDIDHKNFYYSNRYYAFIESITYNALSHHHGNKLNAMVNTVLETIQDKYRSQIELLLLSCNKTNFDLAWSLIPAASKIANVNHSNNYENNHEE